MLNGAPVKTALLFIVGTLPFMACIGTAGYLAAHNVDNWGWFLVLAFPVAFVHVKVGQ